MTSFFVYSLSMKYKHLLFDADNTLFDFTKGEITSFKTMGTIYGLDFNKQLLETYHRINKKCWKDYEKGLLSQDNLKVLRFSNLCEELGLDIDPKDLSDTYSRLLSVQTHLMPHAKHVLDELKGRGYKIEMITNGISETQYGRLEATNLTSYFSNIFISGELGTQKPEIEFFDIVLNTIKARKEDCIIIGDRLESDIKGGLNSNIDTIWLNYLNVEKSLTVLPTYEISSLLEILKIV